MSLLDPANDAPADLPAVQQRLVSLLPDGEGLASEPEQIDLLARSYITDRTCFEAADAEDTLAPPASPPPEGGRKRGPRKRPPICPEQLRATLGKLPTRRYGPEGPAAKVDDVSLCSRMAHVARHAHSKKRVLTQWDLDQQQEFTQARALTYPVLASDRAACLGRSCPDVILPLLGDLQRSRIAREIIGLVLRAPLAQKTCVCMSQLEICKLVVCGKSRLNEVMGALEDRGLVVVLPVYVPGTHGKANVEHRANAYVIGPALVAIRDLWEKPKNKSKLREAGAKQLQDLRRRHEWRIRRGTPEPLEFPEPEEYVALLADGAGPIQEALQNRELAQILRHESGQAVAAAGEELVASIAEGRVCGGEIFEKMVETTKAKNEGAAALEKTDVDLNRAPATLAAVRYVAELALEDSELWPAEPLEPLAAARPGGAELGECPLEGANGTVPEALVGTVPEALVGTVPVPEALVGTVPEALVGERPPDVGAPEMPRATTMRPGDGPTIPSPLEALCAEMEAYCRQPVIPISGNSNHPYGVPAGLTRNARRPPPAAVRGPLGPCKTQASKARSGAGPPPDPPDLKPDD